MNQKGIAFIICVNNDVIFDECKYYIEHLNVPDGYHVDLLEIRDANSMCSAYNEGMQASDAKYKIYMHQDVFIRNKNFLQDIINIFESDVAIGMIGMMGGTHMPKTGVTYRAWDSGAVDTRDPDMSYYLVFDPKADRGPEIEAVDGLLMATQYDVAWREDIFTHFDFYDVSQSFEMRKAGYKICVPEQPAPWTIHDCGFAKLNHYDEARQICQKEYPEYLYAEGGYDFIYNEEWNNLSDALSVQVKQMMEQGAWNQVAAVIEAYRQGQMKSSMLEMQGIMSDVYRKELQSGVAYGFFDDLHTWQEIYEKYMRTRFLMRRMELDFPESEYEELIIDIKEKRLSCEALIEILVHSVVDKKNCLKKCIGYYKQSNQLMNVNQLEQIYEQVKKRDIPLAYTDGKNK